MEMTVDLVREVADGLQAYHLSIGRLQPEFKVSTWCFTQATLAMPVIQTDSQADGEDFDR